MFSSLFGRKKLKDPLDLGVLGADMHSHLIPGIDDGSPTMEASIMLVKGMKALGYRKLITTPHIGSDIYKNTPEIIQHGLEQLNSKLAQEKVDIQVEAAAEYLMDDGFATLLTENRLITFGNNYVLLELPYFNLPPNLYELTFELQIKGFKIILAHPERYLYWYNDFKKFEELKDRGIYFQLNMISLSGHYSPEVKKMAEKLTDAGMVDFLGSDLHNAYYLEVLRKTTYEIYLEKLLNSGKLLNHTL
jgi:protein-tyrosine phosphatase